jgi:peptide/nickel transport system substrate-binding protein
MHSKGENDMKALRVLLVLTMLVIALSQVIACAPAPEPTEPPEPTAAPAAEEPTAVPVAEEPTAAPVVEEEPPAASEFVGLVRNHPERLDPHVGNDNPFWKFMIGVYEPLVGLVPGSMELTPALAESWQVSDDGTEYTFKLREGVKFHDGTILDAEDVKVSLDRIKEIGLGYAWALEGVDQIEVVDPMTVKLDLAEPSATFIDAMPLFLIVSADAINEHEVDGDLGQAWLAENVAGTGPYMLDSWTLGEQIELTKFEDYWAGWEGDHVDRVVTRLVEEPGTQTLIVEAGDAHWGDSISLEDAGAMEEDPSSFKVLRNPSPNLLWFVLNTDMPPLDDVKVRQAIRYAFDYESVVNDILNGHARIPKGYLLPEFREHDPSIPEEHQDMAKAKELMAEAGYPDGGFSFELLFFPSVEHERRAAELFQANLAELGIDVELTGELWAATVEKATNPDIRPGSILWFANPETSSPDSGLWKTFHCDSGHWSNYGYCNAEVDRLLEEAATELDEAKRTDLYRQVQQVLQEDSPAVNAYIEETFKVFSSDVEGYTYLPMHPDVVDYYLISLKE